MKELELRVSKGFMQLNLCFHFNLWYVIIFRARQTYRVIGYPRFIRITSSVHDYLAF
jgi:hypothetical protein